MFTELAPEDRARLKAARDRFVADMQTRTPAQQRARANRLANSSIGFGEGQVDPYESSMARQMLEIMQANERIEAMRAEIKQIDGTDLSGYRPKDPHFAGRALTRRAELQEEIKREQARAARVADDDLSREQTDAAKLYRAEEKRLSKAQALRDAVTRQAAEQEKAEIEARAAGIVKAERLANGGNDGVEVSRVVG